MKNQNKLFRVGDVFQHQGTRCVPQYYGEKFKIHLLAPAQDKIISLGFPVGQLEEYVLPESMSDTQIQNATRSLPMDEETFWRTYFYLIIMPKKSKKFLGYELDRNKEYVIHVKLDSGSVWSVGVNCHISDLWGAGAYGFDRGRSKWRSTRIFLYFPNTKG